MWFPGKHWWRKMARVVSFKNARRRSDHLVAWPANKRRGQRRRRPFPQRKQRYELVKIRSTHNWAEADFSSCCCRTVTVIDPKWLLCQTVPWFMVERELWVQASCRISRLKIGWVYCTIPRWISWTQCWKGMCFFAFYRANQWVASVDLFANEEAHANVIVDPKASWTEQETEVRFFGGSAREKMKQKLSSADQTFFTHKHTHLLPPNCSFMVLDARQYVAGVLLSHTLIRA